MHIYTGKGHASDNPQANAYQDNPHYLAADSLAEAINMALYLRRPLLVEGEPGCGKTQLAYSVAYELGYPLKTCYIRSTTRAQDLLYTYDAVKRLYDIQEIRAGDSAKTLPPRQSYVEWGQLGEALKLSEQDKPSVVLIDEIDKADIDFPNDLLQVLEELRFEVGEVKEQGNECVIDALKSQPRAERKDSLPLIIITSNREKELPKPFLRRCLFYYIEFPDRYQLADILKSHFSQKSLSPLFSKALDKFWELREQNQFRWRKIPGTSEFLDWARILEMQESLKNISAKELEQTAMKDLPFMEALIKTQGDLEAMKRLD